MENLYLKHAWPHQRFQVNLLQCKSYATTGQTLYQHTWSQIAFFTAQRAVIDMPNAQQRSETVKQVRSSISFNRFLVHIMWVQSI